MLDPKIRAVLCTIVENVARIGLLQKDGPFLVARGKDVAVYPQSWRRADRGALFVAWTPYHKYLVTMDLDWPLTGEKESVAGHRVGICPCAAENAVLLREMLPFTAPAKLPDGLPSFGCGDRLGLANPGHLRLLGQYRVAPVLAQQSMRELALTGRTFGQVIDAATWAVLQEGYEDGYGADGDHLKTIEEVNMVLAAGASMVTLDLSLCLGAAGGGACPAELRVLAGQVFTLPGAEIAVSAAEIEEFWRNYATALDFAAAADASCRRARGTGRYDLEVSVDETAHTTRPVDHLFLAFQLQRMGIQPLSIAPRFPGGFQKGIDYTGDLDDFARAFRVHAAVARHFEHKVSIHSGSDKFAVFPVVARLAGGSFHEKTAGTSWLEALRVAAARAPELFRRIWARAYEVFPEAKKYYYIRTELADVPPLPPADGDLPVLLDQEAPRQFLHITYGGILQAPDLGSEFFAFLHDKEEAYYAALEQHFRRHLEGLEITHRR